MKRIIFFLTLCFFFSSQAKAEASKSFDLKKLEEKYKNTESLEADFTQEVYQVTLARTKTSNGTISLAKPNRVRWETIKPDPNIMVSNGSKLWFYTPAIDSKGKAQILEGSVKELIRQPIYQILTGKAKLNKEFIIEKIEKPSPELTQLELKPRKSVADTKVVFLTVDAKYLITEVLIHHLRGNKTKISLQNTKLGAKLPSQLFNFKPPAGSDVIQGQ